MPGGVMNDSAECRRGWGAVTVVAPPFGAAKVTCGLDMAAGWAAEEVGVG
jgi:hypothetical protein